ncbi:MAG TPA: EAL domain-containing protein [Pararobbsia sp.]|nr:EAL domain-containing protein [Pararobbsia sp.]
MNPTVTSIGQPLGLPDLEPALLFFIFAAAAVHVCQRLVEQAAVVIGAEARRASFARTALCVGCIVWALDAAGLFMYPDVVISDARLAPAILALIVMVVTGRWTIPPLTNTRSHARVVLAAVVLAIGMLAGNALMLSAFGRISLVLSWQAGAGALVLSTVLAAGLALRHRSARLRKDPAAYLPFSWQDKVLGGLTVVPLHVCLVNMFVLSPTTPAHGGGLTLMLALVLFGIVGTAYQVRSLRSDARQERSMNLALMLQNSAHARLRADGGQRLALIAERLPALLTPLRMALHFQPIVAAEDVGGTVRLEALLRIHDPDLGYVDPELFFLACERLGFTSVADRIVIRSALEASESWCQPDFDCLGISVNITPNTPFDDDFVEWLRRQMRETRCPPGWLKLELTEHAMIHNAERLSSVIRELGVLGVGVVMDDFGAGYSSLAMLGDLPIEGIKCDRSFVSALEHDRRRQALLRHICAMARELNLKVTIEGIETESDLKIVRRLGAHDVQGYHLARPMPASAVARWLLTRRSERYMQAPSRTTPEAR